MTAPVLDDQQAPTTERAIPGTFTVEVENPEFSRCLLPRRQPLTFSPRERVFETREQPHRGLTYASICGHRLGGDYSYEGQRIEVTGIGGLVIGLPLTYLNEYGEPAEWGTVRRAWMTPESPKPTISVPGEAVVFDDGSFRTWHIERLGVHA